MYLSYYFPSVFKIQACKHYHAEEFKHLVKTVHVYSQMSTGTICSSDRIVDVRAAMIMTSLCIGVLICTPKTGWWVG